MLIQDAFIEQFYSLIKSKHTLVLVNEDVDALCASMILLHAFSCDDSPFSLCPVDSVKAIEKAIDDYSKQCKQVIMVNCGGHISLLDIELPQDITIFVVDSRRPFHLDNIYNEKNIRLLVRSSEVATWDVPDAQFIYDEDESSSEDDEEGDRTATIERRILKREEKNRWQNNRAQMLWKYYNHSWYSEPSSIFMLKLVHLLGKSNAQTVWCAATGLCSQLADGLISSQNYLELCNEHMMPFIAKYGRRNERSKKFQGEEIMMLTFEKELMLPLYTKWDLYNALTQDVGFCCSTRMWAQEGESKMKHTLASIGITLEECRQSYEALKTDRKEEIFSILDKHLNSMFFCFRSYRGYNQSLSAIDFARILSLRLEFHMPHSTETLIDRFQSSQALMQSFFKNNGYLSNLDSALEQYKLALKTVQSLVFGVLKQGMITAAGRNFYLVTLDHSNDVLYLSSRHCLNLFLFFALSGFVSNKKKMEKPFFAAVPSDLTDENTRYLCVTGCMPFIHIVRDLNRKTSIPMVFKQVCEQLKIPIIRNSLDPSVIQIREEDKNRFFDHLDIMLDPA